MNDSGIVHQQSAKGLGERKAHAVMAIEFKHTGFAPFDPLTPNKYDGDKINPIAMGAFWGGAANSALGINTKLMRFYIPLLGRFNLRKQLAEPREQGVPAC